MKTIRVNLLCCLLAFLICRSIAVFSAPATSPTVENVKISGIEMAGNTLSLSYDFIDPEKTKDNSSFIWQFSDDNISFFNISGANSRAYTISREFAGKYIRGAIIPINSLNIIGEIVNSASVGPVFSKSIPDGISMPGDSGQGTKVFFDTITDLQALGIIDNVTEEELRLDESLARAEFAKIIALTTNWDTKSTYSSGKFADVPNDHWAAEYIGFMSSVGIFEGSPGGLFRPDDEILLQDALKAMVTLLGYKIKIVESGYPTGYIIQAAELGLLKGIGQNFENAVSRREIFQLIKNALDVDILTQDSISVGNSVSYSAIRGNTLRNALLASKDFIEGEGVITATFEAFLLEANLDIKSNEVEINGIKYKIGETNAQDYFGEKVYFSAFKNEITGERILNAISVHKNTQILNIEAEDYEGYQNFELSYNRNKNQKPQKVKISKNAAIIYNNRPITDWEQFNIKNGSIKLIDNTDDNVYDIVLINDYVSVPVSGVNLTSEFIRILEGIYYKGSRSIPFFILDNDVQNIAYNNDGEEIGLADIMEDGVVSIFESGDGTFLKIIYSDTKIDGMINEISEETITIDNKAFEYEKEAALSKVPVAPGIEVTAYLNFDKKIAFINPLKNASEHYGYIIGKNDKGINNIKIQVITAGTVELTEEDPDNDPETDNSVKVLVAKNDKVQILTMADKFRIEDADGVYVTNSDVKSIPINMVIRFTTNTNGEVSKICIPKIYGLTADKVYNATDNVFGKAMFPFGIGDDTEVLCIPTNTVMTTNDYIVPAKMQNGLTYRVSGYDFIESDSNVKIFVIYANMNYEDAGSIGTVTKMAVVQSRRTVLNKEGYPITRFVLLTEGMEKQMNIAEYADESKITSLKNGDVIYYSQNFQSEFVDFDLLESLSISGGYYNLLPGTSNETVFGMPDEIIFGEISIMQNRRVNIFNIQTDEFDKNVIARFEVHTTNAPPIFIYKKQSSSVSFGTIDDIRTYSTSGVSADKVFMHIRNGIVQGIVIVRD